MSVVSIDEIVAQIILEVGRLPVATDGACRSDIGVAGGCPFLDLDRYAAVFDIADIAVVQRLEMRDVEQVLDQLQCVGGHRHRPGIASLPSRIDDLPDARRPDRRSLSVRILIV